MSYQNHQFDTHIKLWWWSLWLLRKPKLKASLKLEHRYPITPSQCIDSCYPHIFLQWHENKCWNMTLEAMFMTFQQQTCSLKWWKHTALCFVFCVRFLLLKLSKIKCILIFYKSHVVDMRWCTLTMNYSLFLQLIAWLEWLYKRQLKEEYISFALDLLSATQLCSLLDAQMMRYPV